MSFNLVRNSRVFFTTNVNQFGIVQTTGLLPANTFELQVLDGFSFSQNTQSETVTLNEAGDTPVRGQRSFNTSLDPVDFSFSTYLRPRLDGGVVTAEESVLWNAVAGSAAIGSAALTGGVFVDITRANTSTALATISLMGLTSTDLVVGGIYTVGGITGTYADEWTTPVRIVAIDLANDIIDVEYLTAPSVAAGLTVTTATSFSLDTGAWSSNANSAIAHFGNSNKHQLQTFGMIFIVDGISYAVDNCAVDQASIDFGLDAIAMVAWTGKGTQLRNLAATTVTTGATPTFTGGLTGTAAGKNTTAPYIANKLSTMKLISNIGGISGTEYSIAITGGNLTIANNLTYLTPANLGIVNVPITYFTGTRAISGNVTAYLRGGSGNPTSKLLGDMLAASASATDPKFYIQLEVGGRTNPVRVELEMNAAMLTIPTVNVEQVISTQINFTAQGHTSAFASAADYDISNTNELLVRYYAA